MAQGHQRSRKEKKPKPDKSKPAAAQSAYKSESGGGKPAVPVIPPRKG